MSGELIGMSNPRSPCGPCQWCGAEAAQLVTIRPANGTGLDITARACSVHAELVREDPRHPGAVRRKHARGVDQPRLFEVPEATGSAIHV